MPNTDLQESPDGFEGQIVSHGLSPEEVARNHAAATEAFTQFIESTKASVGELLERNRQLTASLTEAQARLTEITSIGTQAVAARTQIADAQAVIATKSDHIQKAQEHADAVRANLDRAFTAATQRTTEITAEVEKARSFAVEAAAKLDEIQKLKSVAEAMRSAAEAEGLAAERARKSAETAAEVSKNLADKAGTTESRVADYERRLAELEAQCKAQLETITKLLPGATSAGLAHAFDKRRETFLKPQGRWQLAFIGSIGMIVAIAVTGLWQVYHSGHAPTYDELLRLWLARLPVAGALVWLALHASREVALAKRLEEDYGYKAATASCFEGFQKQMAEVQSTASDGSPLAILCRNTLQTIASPPGRIYDRHKLIVSPGDGVKDAAKAVADAAAAVKPS